MTERLSKITILLLVIQQLSMAAINPLLDPSKKSSTIIDIGYNKETIPTAVNIPKTLMDIPALSKEIDKKILLKQRDIVTKDCLIDDNGFETCPQDMESCRGDMLTSSGTSTPHSNTIYTPKIVISTPAVTGATFGSRLVSGCNYIWVSDGSGGDGGGPGGEFTIQSCSLYIKNTGLVNTSSFKETAMGYISLTPFDNSDRLVTSCSKVWVSDGSGGDGGGPGGSFVTHSCQTVINNGTLINNDYHSDTFIGYINKVSFTNSDRLVTGCTRQLIYIGGGGEGDPTPEWVNKTCSTYIKNGSLTNDYYHLIETALGYISKSNQSLINCPTGSGTLVGTQCQKTSCPTDYVDNESNCKKDYTYYTYTCPTTEGEDTADITWADANPMGSWFGPVNAGGDCSGIGVNHGGSCNSAVAASDNCFRTQYVCASDPTKDCAKIASNDPIGTNIFNGYQYNSGFAIQHENTLTEPFSCKNGGTYNAAKEACVVNKSYTCSKVGYTYNETIGECIADAVCNDFWNPTTNTCDKAPIVECQPGFTYSTISMSCEKTMDCVAGTLNTSSNKCESAPNCGTEPGWRYDETTMQCYKDLDVVDLLYPPVTPSLQRQFTMDEFQHDTLVFDVTWGSADLDLHASARNASGGEMYHLSYRSFCANGGCLNHDDRNGGTEEIRIPVAQWKAAGVKTVNMDMDAFGGGTLSNYSATASYTDKDGIKRTFPLVGNARYLTLITFDLETFKITYKAPEVVIPVIIINYCDPSPQYQLVGESLCYFDYNNYNICPINYTYSPTYNICYKSTGQEVLETRTYQKSPSCQGGGLFNSDKRLCELTPTCFNGTADFVNNICLMNETNTCFSPTVLRNGIKPDGNPLIAGYDKVCANSNLCSDGGVSIMVEGVAKCKSEKELDCPEGYIKDPGGSNQCLSGPECSTGFVKNDTNCKLTYNWSTYECSAGWQGPVEAGADCNGSCSEDGCWCNSANSPANNCKKLATVSTAGSFTTIEKRNMDEHTIRGTAFSPEDLGEFRNMTCGADCAYYINKISGNGNNLCFEKKNGEKKCLPVDNCYFEGEINPNTQAPKDFIKTLSLLDAHTLRSNYYMLMGDLGAPRVCTVGLFNESTNKCQPENVNDYSRWAEQGSDSNWVSTTDNTGDAAMNQTINTNNNAFYLHPIETQEVVIEGDIGVRTCIDDDTIGLVWGYIDENNYYGLMWSGKVQTNGYGTTIGGGSDTGMRLIQVKNGNTIELKALGKSYGWTCGSSVPSYSRIKVAVTTDTIKIFKNNVEVISYTSSTPLISGKNGYFGLSQPDAWYKNFSIIGEPKCAAGTFFDTRDNHCHSYTCDPGYTLDYNTNTCVQAIVSTCRMNGHVGWTGRSNGISAIGNGGLKTTVALLGATGSASYDSNNNWSGYNIANMAVRLNDGLWYVVDEVRDAAGNLVNRGELPSSVKTLKKEFFQVLDTTNTLNCKIGGKQLQGLGYCGTSIKMVLPGTKMTVTGFSDVESLFGLPAKVDNNTFNLNVTIGSNPFDYKGSGKKEIQDLTGLPNLILEPDYGNILSNKIDFWDSFVDKDIGFLEFIREVKNEDRADNFVPENVVPYDMLSRGFTVNEYLPDANKVLFVKPTQTTAVECNSYAALIGGSVAGMGSFPAGFETLALSRGVGETGACAVLTNDTKHAFDFTHFAIRKNIYNGGFDYKCSPYTCLNHECATATCPTEEIGGTNMQNGVTTATQTVRYIGTTLPDMLVPSDPSVCTDNVCDGKLPFVQECGRTVGCDIRDNVTYDPASDKCYQFYCDNGGVLNTAKNTCEVFKCPFGTIENAAGKCVRP